MKAKRKIQSSLFGIGLCLLDVQTLEISDNRGIMVKPERSEVSEFCTELTTITSEMVADGVSFAEACKILRKEYDSRNRVWASFGAYDLNQFKRQCQLFGVSYPFGPSHINVKVLFALKQKLTRQTGMDGALKMLNIPLEGTHHRGVDDAKNIAKILGKLLD